MKDILQYNGFIGSVHFDADDAVFYGKIEGIGDLVTFEGESVAELQQAFKEAIEDYIEICEQKGKAIHKSYKGNLNVRISSELHRKAMQKSLILGISLNQFIKKAIEREIVNNNQTKLNDLIAADAQHFSPVRFENRILNKNTGNQDFITDQFPLFIHFRHDIGAKFDTATF